MGHPYASFPFKLHSFPRDKGVGFIIHYDIGDLVYVEATTLRHRDL